MGDVIVKCSGDSFPFGLFEVVATAERRLRMGDSTVDRDPVRPVL